MNTIAITEHPNDLLTRAEVKHSIGVKSDSSFYDLIKKQGLPKPVKLGSSSKWVRSEIEAWKANLLAVRDAA